MRKFILSALCTALFFSCKKDTPLTTDTSSPSQTFPAKIFVANENGTSVQMVDVNDPQNNTSIDISDKTHDMLMPHNVQVAPDGKSVWVTLHPMNFGAKTQVLVLDPVTLLTKKRIYVGVNYHLAHVVLNDNCTYAFVTATDSDRVVMIETENYTIVKSFMLPIGHAPHGMRYYNGKLYVACMDAKCLTIIDVASGSITDVALGGIGIQTAVTKNGRYVFISLYDTKEVVRYEIQTGQLAKLQLPSESQGPIQLYCTPDSKTVMVCDQGNLNGRPASNKVYEIDIASLTVTHTIEVGTAAHGIVISKDCLKAFVTNSEDNTVSVIDIKTHAAIQTIPVGLDPNGIGYWYEGGGMP